MYVHVCTCKCHTILVKAEYRPYFAQGVSLQNHKIPPPESCTVVDYHSIPRKPGKYPYNAKLKGSIQQHPNNAAKWWVSGKCLYGSLPKTLWYYCSWVLHVHVGWGRERGTLESILLFFNGKFMWHECAPVFMCHTCVIGIDVQGTTCVHAEGSLVAHLHPLYSK